MEDMGVIIMGAAVLAVTEPEVVRRMGCAGSTGIPGTPGSANPVDVKVVSCPERVNPERGFLNLGIGLGLGC